MSVPSRKPKLTAECATALAAYGVRTVWPSNFLIYQKGASADGISLVLRGHVVLRNKARSGRGFVPAIVTPGETFGVEGISDEVYVTDANASDETETLFLSAEQFRAFVRENTGLALCLVGMLMSERTSLLEKLHMMASQNVEQRLIASLQRLSTDRSLAGDDGNLHLEPRHHRLLCEMVGATRESIVLALGKLVGAGIALRKGTTFLVAPTKLTAHISHDGMELESSIPFAQETVRT